MIPVLPVNSSTITPRSWFLNTIEDCEARLDQLRKMDTLQRNTDIAREAEKAQIGLIIKKLKYPSVNVSD